MYKIFLWILAAIAALMALRYIYLFVKRCILLIKLKIACGKDIKFTAFPFRSVFLPGREWLCEIEKDGKKYAVAVLTVPFRRVRCHFPDAEHMEVIYARSPIYAHNAKHGRPVSASAGMVVFTLMRLKLKAPKKQPPTDALCYLIPHPAPFELSKAEGNREVSLFNGDIFFENTRICGLSYFIKFVLEK